MVGCIIVIATGSSQLNHLSNLETSMNKKTATILTFISMFLCGIPAVVILLLGVGLAWNLADQANSTPYDLIFMILSFILGLVLVMVPILLIVFRKRLVKNEPQKPGEPIPPVL
jgi:hypothetical protein